jgi:hypothetical protein
MFLGKAFLPREMLQSATSLSAAAESVFLSMMYQSLRAAYKAHRGRWPKVTESEISANPPLFILLLI